MKINSGKLIRKLLAEYSKTHREDFNQDLFIRSEDDIIDQLLKVIQTVCINSANPNGVNIAFTGYRVIRDYNEIRDKLSELESPENRHNKRIDINEYEYINVKKTDIVILQVGYLVSVTDESGMLRTKEIDVYIDVPRVINKYYFRINGIMYSTLYQIADGSTYNNSTSKKDRGVSLRQIFLKSSIYEKTAKMTQCIIDYDTGIVESLKDIECTNFIADVFKNSVPVCKYFLAIKGYEGIFEYLHMDPDSIFISTDPIIRPDFIVFKRHNYYISVPYFYWNNSNVFQSLVYTIYSSLPKENVPDIYTINFWLASLGESFRTKTVEKGRSILDSTRRNYSLDLIDTLHLNPEDKASMIDMMRWITCQFDDLYNKDNYDICFKKIRIAGYIAGFYASKLTKQLLRVTVSNSSTSVEKVAKQLNIKHDYLITALKKSNLLSYNNLINDDDTFNVLKFTYKGESGIGENKASAVPVEYRLTNPSHISRIDCDTSSAGDPGMTGLICPYTQIQPGGYFTDYQEPNNWREAHDNLINNYKSLKALQQTKSTSLFKTREELLCTKEGSEYVKMLDSIPGLSVRTQDNQIQLDDEE